MQGSLTTSFLAFCLIKLHLPVPCPLQYHFSLLGNIEQGNLEQYQNQNPVFLRGSTSADTQIIYSNFFSPFLLPPFLNHKQSPQHEEANPCQQNQVLKNTAQPYVQS